MHETINKIYSALSKKEGFDVKIIGNKLRVGSPYGRFVSEVFVKDDGTIQPDRDTPLKVVKMIYEALDV